MTSGGATINPAPPSSPPVEPSPPSQPIPTWIIAGLILMYEAAELDLLRTLADIVNRHVDPHDVHQRITLTATLQARVNFIVQQLQRQVSEQLPSTMADAVNWGDRIGYNEVRQVLGDRRARITTPDPGLADRAARDAIDQLRLMHLTVRQVVNNAAQQMHEHAAIESAVSDLHLHDAKQRLLERYARSGATGFVDRRGRRWDLSTYAEMKIRTSATNAAVDAHLARISSSGIGLVHVSDSPRECELCRPWENKILSVSGSVGTYTVPSVLTGEPVRVEVAGSIARARLAGLFHPNCTHFITPYMPGATKLSKAVQDPQGYADAQKLRALERRVRQAKRVEAVALTPAMKTKARDEVRHWQTEVRAHARATDQLRRIVRERPEPPARARREL